MALVTISGYPCSGKSRRALQLRHLLERNPAVTMPINIVNEESLGVDVGAFDGLLVLLCVLEVVGRALAHAMHLRRRQK